RSPFSSPSSPASSMRAAPRRSSRWWPCDRYRICDRVRVGVGTSSLLALAASNVAEPPVLSPCLYARDPSTKWVKNGNHCDPDQVDPRQADAKAFWKEAVVGQELLP